jgi:hypothetical protein
VNLRVKYSSIIPYFGVLPSGLHGTDKNRNGPSYFRPVDWGYLLSRTQQDRNHGLPKMSTEDRGHPFDRSARPKRVDVGRV